MLEQIEQLGFAEELATIDSVRHSFFDIEQDRSCDSDDVVIDTISAEVEGGVYRLTLFIVVVETHVPGDPRGRNCEVDDRRRTDTSTDQIRDIGDGFRVVVV